MSITTKTGDTGTTSLFGGKRVLKSDPAVEAYGSLDELTSFIGLVCSKAQNEKETLLSIQRDLYQIMAFLAGDRRQDFKNIKKQIKNMEKNINKLEEKLPKLTRFIIPSGNEVSSWFHVLRTVCRRAERQVVKHFLSKKLRITCLRRQANYELRVTEYLNRLSDLFFMMARKYNQEEEKLTKV